MRKIDYVHLDIEAFERKLREDLAFVAASVETEFHRQQSVGSEVVVQFALMGARLVNDGVDADTRFHARIALLASLTEGLVGELLDHHETTITPDEAKFRILSVFIQYVRATPELLTVSEAPCAEVGRA